MSFYLFLSHTLTFFFLHPQVFDRTLAVRAGGASNNNNMSSGPSAPRPFLEIMLLKVEQTRLQAEEQQRAQLMSILAMASLSQLLHEKDAEENAQENAQAEADKGLGTRFRSFRELALAAYALASSLLRKGREPVPLFGLAELTGAENGLEGVVGDEEGLDAEGDKEVAQQLSLTGSLSLCWRHRAGRPMGCLALNALDGAVHVEPELFAHLQCHVSHRVLQLTVLAPVGGNGSTAPGPGPCAVAAATRASTQGKVAVQCYPSLLEVLCVPLGGGFLESVAFLKVPLPDFFSDSTSSNSGSGSVASAAADAVLAAVDIPAESVRSRGWRVRVASLHDTAHEVGSSASLSLRAAVMASMKEMVPFVQLRICIREAALDVDFAQELHLAHNYGEVLSDMLAAPRSEQEAQMAASSTTLASSGDDLAALQPPWRGSGIKQTGAQHGSGDTAAVVSVTPHTLQRVQRSSSSSEVDSPLGPTALFAKEAQLPSEQTQRQEKEAIMHDLRSRAAVIEAAALSSRRHTRLQAKATLMRLSGEVEERQQAMSQLSTGRRWWLPVLEGLTAANGNSLLGALEEVVQPDVSGEAYAELRAHLWNLGAVGATLNQTHAELWKAREACLRAVLALADAPSQAEQAQAADCKTCKGYRFRNGPQCSQCRAHKTVDTYYLRLMTFRQKVQGVGVAGGPRGVVAREEGVEDEGALLGHNQNQVTGPFHMLAAQLKRVADCAAGAKQAAGLEGGLAEVLKKEAAAMGNFATMHGELLNAHDELLQNKSRMSRWPMGLAKTKGEEDLRLWDWELRGRYEVQWGKALSHTSELATARGNLTFYRSQLSDAVGDLDPLSRVGKADREGGRSESPQCAICLSALHVDREEQEQKEEEGNEDEPVVLVGCSHRFHRDCIQAWLRKDKSCPLCKTRVKPQQDLQAIQVTPVGSPKKGSNSSKRGSHANPATSRHMGRWGTKVGAVVTDIIALGTAPVSGKASSSGTGSGERDTSSDKVLVFSQWKEMLSIVSCALSAEGVAHEFCFQAAHFSPRGRLSRFKSTADCRVLLLPLAFGAEGLDLTEANHVMLLEPVMNTATEAQAIGRVFRLGQERPMQVHRYLCANTVETYIQTFKQKQQQKLASGSSSSSSSSGGGGSVHTPPRRGQGGDLAELSVGQLEVLLLGEGRTMESAEVEEGGLETPLH